MSCRVVIDSKSDLARVFRTFDVSLDKEDRSLLISLVWTCIDVSIKIYQTPKDRQSISPATTTTGTYNTGRSIGGKGEKSVREREPG